jgi:hypothetical protein
MSALQPGLSAGQPDIDRHPWALGQDPQLTYDQLGEVDWERALADLEPEAEI